MSALILASSSKSRAALLSNAGIDFTISPSDLDEEAVRESLHGTGTGPDDMALILAEAKARQVAEVNPQALVIGADQILSLEERVFTKPATIEDAYKQLWGLRGRTHRLHAAVACVANGKVPFRHVATADLTMRDFSRQFLADYLVNCGETVLASVGAYRLEGMGAQLFEEIDGDYFTILGLPLLALLKFLRQAGELPE